MLRIEATAFDGETNYIIVDDFWIEDESNAYRLHLGRHLEGHSTHSLDIFGLDGMKFSTFDRNNDMLKGIVQNVVKAVPGIIRVVSFHSTRHISFPQIV